MGYCVNVTSALLKSCRDIIKIKKLKKRAKMKAKKRNLSSQLVVSPLPVPTPHIPIALTQPPQHSQHEPDGEVGDVFGQHVGGVRNPNPLLPALREVDLVHSDAEARHDLQPRQRLDQLGIGAGGGVSDDGADRVGVLLDELWLLRSRPELEEVEALLELLLQVRVHRDGHEYANGFHEF